MIIQPILNIAEICAKHGIRHAIICPGSRSAPITLAFARHPKIQTFVIPDERSAGFIGLGMAQSSEKPVVFICTSGTAVVNLYPAIIEAFYQQVPLLILTADRPPEWIDQHDGQTIRQQNIFQHHIRASYQFPVSFDHQEAVWHGEKMISEAIVKSTGIPSGPVHVNIPIREPFYPAPEDETHYSHDIKIIQSPDVKYEVRQSWIKDMLDGLRNYEKIMILAGQTRLSIQLQTHLNSIQKKHKWVIIGDITSNIMGLNHPVTKHDIILKDIKNTDRYKPDLLITFGQSVLSKQLKSFLREERLKAHWHLDNGEELADPFKSLTKKIDINPEVFFQNVSGYESELNSTQNEFYNQWTSSELAANSFVEDYFKVDHHSEFHAVHHALNHLPHNCHLHLANSMVVRYANVLGLKNKINVTTWSNRGTSGIDGCMSTSVGHAIHSNELHVLLIGDLAFFYDRNSLWHSHLPKNLRVVLLNNHGGGIFRMINGPKQLDELEEYFETKQSLNAANTARDFGMKYFNLKNIDALPELITQFLKEESGPAILEIETDPHENQKVFEDFNRKATQLWN